MIVIQANLADMITDTDQKCIKTWCKKHSGMSPHSKNKSLVRSPQRAGKILWVCLPNEVKWMKAQKIKT